MSEKRPSGDLTEGPIFKVLSRLALPIMASSFLSTAYNITDMAWIGMLGADAVAGVGVGVFKDFSVVDQFVKTDKTFYPREEYREVYDRQKKLFELGYQCLLPYYREDV